jgi:sec-independent protein translocase protein TatC
MSPATQAPPPETEVRMTFGEHLEELRWRLVKSLVALLLGFVVATVYYKELVAFIVAPHYRVMGWLQKEKADAEAAAGTKAPAQGELHGQLIAGAYTKPIWAVMKLSFIVGLFASSPYIAYQIWSFIAAGLYPRERKYVVRYAPMSFLLFAGGCAFGYVILIPYGLYGMAQLVDIEGIQATYIFTDYLDLVMGLTIITGAIFQLPLLMGFFSAIGLTTWRTWVRWIKFAVVAIFVAAAILTPTPDVFTQLLLAVPLMGLYAVGIGLSALVGGKPSSSIQERAAK